MLREGGDEPGREKGGGMGGRTWQQGERGGDRNNLRKAKGIGHVEMDDTGGKGVWSKRRLEKS